MANNGNSVRQHKRMAEGKSIGGSGDDFGVEPLCDIQGGHKPPDHGPDGVSNGHLDDKSRAGPPHIGRGRGRMAATAHSDHGPHHIPPAGEGVASLSSVQGRNHR